MSRGRRWDGRRRRRARSFAKFTNFRRQTFLSRICFRRFRRRFRYSTIYRMSLKNTSFSSATPRGRLWANATGPRPSSPRLTISSRKATSNPSSSDTARTGPPRSPTSISSNALRRARAASITRPKASPLSSRSFRAAFIIIYSKNIYMTQPSTWTGAITSIRANTASSSSSKRATAKTRLPSKLHGLS